MTRKSLVYLISVLYISLLVSSCGTKVQSIQDKLIRFHVIANSDSKEDQELKLRVRDSILKEIGPKLEKSKSKEESKQIITDNIDVIKEAAKKEVLKSKKGYEISVALSRSIFPVKTYSNLVLPAGEYDALKVVLGEGEGKNWWCVMFPPLCFIDITQGVTSQDSETRLKTVLDDEEYDEILSSNSGKPGVFKIKFKSVELAQSLFDKLQSAFNKK